MENSQQITTVPQKFIFNNQEIDFEITGEKVMINATQMAKVFDSQVIAFMRNSETEKFIDECFKSENSHYLNVVNESDLFVSTQKTGTWMHRILAIKFAAWLNPAFELWVYSVIDELLFGHYREMEKLLQKQAETKNRIEELRDQLREDNRFSELEELELLDRQYSRRRNLKATNQLELFRTVNK